MMMYNLNYFLSNIKSILFHMYNPLSHLYPRENCIFTNILLLHPESSIITMNGCPVRSCISQSPHIGGSDTELSLRMCEMMWNETLIVEELTVCVFSLCSPSRSGQIAYSDGEGGAREHGRVLFPWSHYGEKATTVQEHQKKMNFHFLHHSA